MNRFTLTDEECELIRDALRIAAEIKTTIGSVTSAYKMHDLSSQFLKNPAHTGGVASPVAFVIGEKPSEQRLPLSEIRGVSVALKGVDRAFVINIGDTVRWRGTRRFRDSHSPGGWRVDRNALYEGKVVKFTSHNAGTLINVDLGPQWGDQRSMTIGLHEITEIISNG